MFALMQWYEMDDGEYTDGLVGIFSTLEKCEIAAGKLFAAEDVDDHYSNTMSFYAIEVEVDKEVEISESNAAATFKFEFPLYKIYKNNSGEWETKIADGEMERYEVLKAKYKEL